LAEVRQMAESRGLAIPMMCYSPDFTKPEKSGRDEEVDKQKAVIRATAMLGGKFCRVLSGQRRTEVSVEQGVGWVVECIQACLPTAQECGIELVIENHYKDGYWTYPEFAQKMEVFLAIVERIDSPIFGVQFDPSNTTMAGEDPVELLKNVAPRVKTMHASDRRLAPGATLEDLKASDGTAGYSTLLLHGVTGQGLNDYDSIFRVLKSANFDGWISIEDGMNGFDELMESAMYLRAKMAEYAL